MKRDVKEQIANELNASFARSKVVILTDYKGLNVTTLNGLRSKLRTEGVTYKVVKNTLLVRASAHTDAALIKQHFKGPSAIAFSETDPVAPARVLTAFAKENEKFEIKAGVLNGKVLSVQDIKALADLPSRDVLLARLLGALNAVPTGLVQVLSAIPRGLLNVLTAIKDQKAEG